MKKGHAAGISARARRWLTFAWRRVQAVPACKSPSRLNRHLTERTNNLDPRFRDTPRYYKLHGEALRSPGTMPSTRCCSRPTICHTRRAAAAGATEPKQNNFAGIGTTGGGVPGDSFPDVSSGALAQMQHLVAYSGER